MNNPITQPCYYTCLSCINGLTCVTCNSTLFRVHNTSTQNCDPIPGYYDNGLNKSAIKCYYTCVTCINGITCNTCNGPTDHRVLNVTTQQCDPIMGYYDDGLGNSITLPCYYTCRACNSYPNCTICDSINDHRTLNNLMNSCDPVDGFYDDGTANRTASPCYYTCTTCNSPFLCLTCDSTYNHRIFNLINSSCDPIDGYYDDGNNNPIAQICQLPCNTCFNTAR